MTALSENLQFLRALMARPRNVGAVLPSGPILARSVAAQISDEGPVLELGPGTGAITGAIIARVGAERVTAIEFDPSFASALKARFPRIGVIQGDAFDLAHTLGERRGPYGTIISGLPLLNFPVADRQRLVRGALDHLLPGGCLVQFSYGLQPPAAAPAGCVVEQAALVWANVPPARVWVYRTA